MTRRRARSAGFTLVEVMIAVLLTAIAMSGLIGLYIATNRASGYSRHATEATVLAQDQMERLRTLTAGAASGTENDLDALGQPGLGIYDRTWTVALAGEYYDMVVTVTWDEDGDTKNVTVYARRSVQ